MNINHTGRLLMSNVISSFLVGIGFDYDKKSAQQIEGGIDSIKSKALQLGAVVAGAFGLKSLTVDFANSADMLGKFGQTFGVSANDVQAFGNALATEGGSLESFMSQLESLERARARILVGDVGFFAPAGKAGLDPNVIADANNATDAYLALADSFAVMNTQQRINAAEALGLDEASIRLLSQGRGAVESLVSKYRSIRPLTGDMTGEAAEFNRQWVEASANIKGVADTISTELLPVINDITAQVNSWFGENKGGIADTVRKVMESMNETSWTDFTLWGNFARLSDTFAESDTANDMINYIKSPFTNSSDINSVVPTGQFLAPNPYMMQLNAPVPSYQPQYGLPTPSDSVAPTSQPQASTRSNSTVQNIDVSLNLDGAVIDRRVIKVVDGMAQTAIDDISSSTGG